MENVTGKELHAAWRKRKMMRKELEQLGRDLRKACKEEAGIAFIPAKKSRTK